MSAIGPVLDHFGAQINALTAQLGRRVETNRLGVIDRQGQLSLAEPGLVSPNRACHMARAADGWIAINLARDEDRDLVPAWLQGEWGEDPVEQIRRLALARPWRELVADAILLGLPACGVGEVVQARPESPVRRMAEPGTIARADQIKVVDLSSLWAGPLCGAIFAEMGAAVTKVESAGRPDPTRTHTPDLFRRLNRQKADLQLDFKDPADRLRLREMATSADVLITGARPRALAALGLDPASVFARNPALIWVAVTGYGFEGEAGLRVAFGDDAAAAGGLVGWTPEGEPRFLGDALGDPVTGLSGAAGALQALTDGTGGVMVEAALARCAAGAAAVCGLVR